MGRKVEYEIERIRIRTIDHAPKAYGNGRYSPLFHAAAAGLAQCKDLKEVDLKVLLHCISILDEKNHFTISSTKVADKLHFSRQAISKSVRKLVAMRIFCADADCAKNSYSLDEFILNARIACWGDTRIIDLQSLPLPCNHETGELLISDVQDPFSGQIPDGTDW